VPGSDWPAVHSSPCTMQAVAYVRHWCLLAAAYWPAKDAQQSLWHQDNRVRAAPDPHSCHLQARRVVDQGSEVVPHELPCCLFCMAGGVCPAGE
jgi:hypothetical protein